MSDLEFTQAGDAVAGLLKFLDQWTLPRREMPQLSDLSRYFVCWGSLNAGGLNDHGEGEGEYVLLSEGALPENPRVAVELPQVVTAALILYVQRRPWSQRINRVIAVQYLLGQWRDLLQDDEKMIGHLIVAHGIDSSVVDIGLEARLEKHRELHSKTSPHLPSYTWEAN